MFKKTLFVILASATVVSFADNLSSSTPVAATPTTQPKQFDKNNAVDSNQANSPNVNSRLYSGAQFPEQNNVTGQKGVKYQASKPVNQNSSDKAAYSRNNATDANQANSPTVNSRLYSGSQFPEQNNITGQKKQKYYTKEQRKQKLNNPNVNSRLYSGAQFPQQNSFNNNGKSHKKQTTASAAQ